MKLSPRDAPAYLAKPDPARAGTLIYGADAMRVALKRQELIANLIGPKGDEEMRLSRMTGAELRKDPAALLDQVKAVSFFPGNRVAFVDEATESNAKQVVAALDDWASGDAHIVVTAGSLKASSAMRKAFEAHKNAFALPVYDDPPNRTEIEAILSKAGLPTPPRDAMEAIEGLARSHDPGEFRQIVEKIALYKIGDTTPLSPEDIAAAAPSTAEAATDDLIHAVAETQDKAIGPLVRRLQAQGVQPVGLSIAATRHFRQLLAAASDPGGAAAGMGKLRPPVFGPRRDRMVRQASKWGPYRLEEALHLLLETDLTLRSSSQAPQMAFMERSLIRLAMMGQR